MNADVFGAQTTVLTNTASKCFTCQIFDYLWHLTWSCSRCDVDRVVAVQWDSLIGVVIWVICEHLQEKSKGQLLAAQQKLSVITFGLLWTTWRTHRVSSGLQQSQFPRSEKNKLDWAADGWLWSQEGKSGVWIPTLIRLRCWRTGWALSRPWGEPRRDSPWDCSLVESHLQQH